MKTFFAAGLMLLFPSLRGDVDPDRMIGVLVQLEGGEQDDLGGPAHMQEGTWSDRTRLPYYLSRKREHWYPRYREHLEWIFKQLPRYGIKATPKSVALVWRYGLNGAKRRKFEGSYGDRASNLAELP